MNVIVAGVEEKSPWLTEDTDATHEPFLGYVTIKGTAVLHKYIATGMGQMMLMVRALLYLCSKWWLSAVVECVSRSFVGVNRPTNGTIPW